VLLQDFYRFLGSLEIMGICTSLETGTVKVIYAIRFPHFPNK
jgi:hypothetical protein